MSEYEKLVETKPYAKFMAFIREPGQKAKTVGMGFMKGDHSSYCLRLWSFMHDRFYIVPKKGNPREFSIMTREENRLRNPKTQFHWNVVGSASKTDDDLYLTLNFDLFEKTIFMNLLPDVRTNRYPESINA